MPGAEAWQQGEVVGVFELGHHELGDELGELIGGAGDFFFVDHCAGRRPGTVSWRRPHSRKPLTKDRVFDRVVVANELVAIHTRNASISSRVRSDVSTTSGRPVRNVEKRARFSAVAVIVLNE